jgi:hypothetical protein
VFVGGLPACEFHTQIFKREGDPELLKGLTRQNVEEVMSEAENRPTVKIELLSPCDVGDSAFIEQASETT